MATSEARLRALRIHPRGGWQEMEVPSARIAQRAAELGLASKTDAELAEAESEIEELLRHEASDSLEVTYSAIVAAQEARRASAKAQKSWTANEHHEDI